MEYLFGWLTIALFVGVIITGFILALHFTFLCVYPALKLIFFLITSITKNKEKLRKENNELEEKWFKNATHQIAAASAFLILIFVFDLWFFQIYNWSLIKDFVEGLN